MPVRLALLALVLAATARAPARAQAPTARFRTVSLDAGLSQSTVMAVLRDRAGYLWLGTEDGLNRSDGYAVTTFRHRPGVASSLSDSYVLALHQDRRGRLWVGTSDGGLNVRDPATGRFRAFRATGAAGALPHDRVTALAEDASGHLWVGTRGGGLARLALYGPGEPSGRFEAFRADSARAESLPSDEVWTLALDARGRLWVGTRGGGLAWTPTRRPGRFTRYAHDARDAHSLPSDEVLAVAPDAAGAVWVGTFGGGVARLDPASGVATRLPAGALPSPAVSALRLDRRGDLWIGMFGAGVARLRPAAGRPTAGRVAVYAHDATDPHSLPDDYVRALYETPDASGLVWVGTTSGGAAAFNPATDRFQHVRATPGGLPSDYVRAFAEDVSGALWVGTRDGLCRERAPGSAGAPGGWRCYGPADGLALPYIRALATDRAGTLWVGAADGLYGFDGARFTRYPHEPGAAGDGTANVIYALAEGAPGTLWVGTQSGLRAFDTATRRFTRHVAAVPDDPSTLSAPDVIALALGPDGALWAGTTNGLNRVDVRTGRVRRYVPDADDAGALSDGRVFALLVQADGTPGGRVWAGTSAGLNRLDDAAAGRFTCWAEAEGLANGVVYGVLEDARSRLWLSTNRGLIRFDPAASRAGHAAVRTWDESDGLQAAEFNQNAAFRTRSGDLLFGGIAGYNRFRPGGLAANGHRPPVVLTAFRIFDRAVDAARMLAERGALRVGPGEAFVSFEFAALDFANPARNRYQYRLDGLDDAWHDAGTRRFVSYTNLDGGRYTFRVRGSNNDGLWSRDGLAVPLVVVPPVWARWWFRLAAGLALLGAVGAGVWGVARRRLRAAARRRDEAAEVQRRLGEAREAERRRLARDLHDGPIQDLLSANLQLSVAAQALAAEASRSDLAAAQATLSQVGGALRAVCGELRPPALGPFGVGAALRSHVRGLADAHPGVVFTTTLDADGQALPEDVRLGLFRIAQEALANAVRHAAPQHVHVAFALDAEAATLSVRDDGAGFAVPARPLEGARGGHYGLLGMHERAAQLGTALGVSSAPGRGTTVRVVVRPAVPGDGADRLVEAPARPEAAPADPT